MVKEVKIDDFNLKVKSCLFDNDYPIFVFFLSFHLMKNLFYLALITIFSALLSESVLGFIALSKTDFNSTEALNLLREGRMKDRWFFLFLQGLNNLLVWGLPAFITFYFIQKQKLKILFAETKTLKLSLLIGLGVLLTALPLINYAEFINDNIPLPAGLETYFRALHNSVENIYRYTLDIHGYVDFIATCFVIAVIPAIVEEFMFRGLVQTNLAKMMNIHWAIGLSSFIFAGLHFQFYLILPRFCISVLIGYAFFYSGNLLIPMLMHFIFNSLTLGLVYFFGFDVYTSQASNSIFLEPSHSGCILCFSISFIKHLAASDLAC